MKATEILMEEHRVIERVLTALELATLQLKKGAEVRPGFFTDATDFVKGFADGCHHKKEENVLFPSLEALGQPAYAGPVAAMRYEHDQGRGYIRGLRAAAERLDSGETRAKQAVVENALGYITLLRQHIQKEDGILFPLADRALPPAEQGEVAERFEHIEHEETGEGVHEKYLALAEALEAEAQGTPSS